MLTRFVKIQLAIFTILSVVGIVTMLATYVRVPVLLGIGRISVVIEMPRAAGLYRFANVTFRGIEVGKVVDVSANANQARVQLSVEGSVRIPASSTVYVRSMSAIGEQYVDFEATDSSGPYLDDGALIPASSVVTPVRTGPMLDRVGELVASVPPDRLNALVDESFTAFNGAGDDLGALIDSTEQLATALNAASNQSAALVDDGSVVLGDQLQSADALRSWTRSLAGVTTQLVDDDPHVRTILDHGPGLADQVSQLLAQLKPTLPILLSNLTTIGQIAVTYRPGIEQLLVLLPPTAASFQATSGTQNYTGIATGDFRLQLDDPPGCTVGYLPQTQWRSPSDTTTIDTPDGLYCKLPQDSPLAVRGARNYPCMNAPGKRAPTVQLCYSDQGYQPLAERQHVLGPGPIDPNLISQGLPLDDRVDPAPRLYAPVEGTPPPGGAAAPPPVPDVAPPPGGAPATLDPGAAPENSPPPAPPSAAPAAPASASSNNSRPSVAVATYDPQTGLYVTADGQTGVQADLGAARRTASWKDLVLRVP